jgi:hypothetical protein
MGYDNHHHGPPLTWKMILLITNNLVRIYKYIVHLKILENIVWRTGIGTPSLRPGPPQGKFQGAERGVLISSMKRRAKFMELMSTPNGATHWQQFYIK